VIDSCTLIQDSSLLQQASSLTSGLYFKIPQLNGILNYLLWLFLPDEKTRKMLVYPTKTEVDFRAACFCHHKLIDAGYVCSVCLSVFCSFTPICTTCNANFKFDVNMLKKATTLKHGSLASKLVQQHRSSLDRNDSNSNSNSNLEDYSSGNMIMTHRLTSQFQDTSIHSPMMVDDQMSSIEMDNMIDQQEQSDFFPTINTRIITAAMPSNGHRPQPARNNSNTTNLNDSLEMLE
jgi:hypothetical protein